MREQPVCEKCGKPVHVVPTIGQPMLDDWYCDEPSCSSKGRNQGPRLRGKNYRQQSFVANGKVVVFQRGKELQGEENVRNVAKALVQFLGGEYAWQESSGPEIGSDFWLIEPSNRRREVQVVRAVDQKFCADLGSNAGHEAEQEVSGVEFMTRVAQAISNKTERTPPMDRQERVLAVDMLCSDFALFLASSSRPQRWWDKVHRWAGRKGWYAVVVVGAQMSWPLGSERTCRPGTTEL